MSRVGMSGETGWSSTGPRRSRSASKGIWQAYITGQFFSVCKAALWWSTVGLLSMTLLDSELGLGATRGAFNVALLLSSPLAVQAAEDLALRPLLLHTTSLRLAVWSVGVPILYWLTATGLAGDDGTDKIRLPPAALWTLVCAATFIDGIGAAYANSVDIDCGGLDILSAKYDLRLTDYVRFKYTSLHQAVFDAAFLAFVTPFIALLYFLSTRTPLTNYLVPPHIED
ncbi:putative transmembrane protein, partial [Gregarina niphandrodes]